MKLRIALGQMEIAFGNPDANLRTVEQLAAESAAQGADLLLLPELWSTGYDLERAAELASPLDGGIFAQMQDLARAHHLAIAGSLLARQGGKLYNTAALIDADGRNLGFYSKKHLFRMMREDRFLTPGVSSACLDTPWGRAGFAICFDLRFPSLSWHYGKYGARLLLLPAEWPRARLDHWRILLRARAIENQMFVAACNCVGRDPENVFGGQSCVIDPWGECLVEAGDAAGLAVVEIDLSTVDRVRAQYPFLKDRRL